MDSLESFASDVKTLQIALGYGFFRKMSAKYEVRVKDLDRAIVESRRIIEKHRLKINLQGFNPQLRSFEIIEL